MPVFKETDIVKNTLAHQRAHILSVIIRTSSQEGGIQRVARLYTDVTNRHAEIGSGSMWPLVAAILLLSGIFWVFSKLVNDDFGFLVVIAIVVGISVYVYWHRLKKFFSE